MRKLISSLTFLGVALLPVYLWSSGGAQVSHYVLITAAGLILFRQGLRLSLPGLVLLTLATYALVREVIAIGTGAPPIESLLPVAYLFYNLILFEALSKWFVQPANAASLVAGLFGAAFISIAGVIAFGYSVSVNDEAVRAVGTFNNPNQLGYFSVCLLSLAGVMAATGDLGKRAALAVLGTAVALALLSLSKAAIISVAIGVIFGTFVLSPSRNAVIVGTLSVIAIVGSTLYLYFNGLLDQFRFVSRLSSIGRQSDDTLTGRGYHVLVVDNPVHLLFGRGASDVLDFVGHEVHSTLISFFGSYGVIGLMLFGIFVCIWTRRLMRCAGSLVASIAVVPAMLYGLTHNGSRFTFFWILAAFSIAISSRARKQNE